MPTPLPPPRLWVTLAAEADVGVVFRRGPSAWYHVVRWNLARDTFEPGAWLRGRMYPEKCDLSPDGELLLYFVHQGRKAATSYTDSWTGVSRAPWLTALGLWPSGTTYGGGGRFVGARRVRLRTACAARPHPDHPGHGLTVEFGACDEQRSTGEVQGADWSGRDRSGQLVFAREGKLFRRSASGKDRVVADFSGMSPHPVAAPAWAIKPLGAASRRR